MPDLKASKVVKQEGRSRRKMKKDLKTLIGTHLQARSPKFLEYERRTLIYSRRKRLDTILQTGAHGGTQEDEKLKVLAENVAKDSVMEEAHGDDAETIGGDAEEGEEDADDEGLETYRDAGATGGDAEKGEKDADDESVETGRDAGATGGDAKEGEKDADEEGMETDRDAGTTSEDADDEDIETDREAGGVAFATEECVDRSI